MLRRCKAEKVALFGGLKHSGLYAYYLKARVLLYLKNDEKPAIKLDNSNDNFINIVRE